MKKHILFCSTFLFIFLSQNNFLSSQEYQFYIGGGTSWFSEAEYTQIRESSILSPVFGSDSLFLSTPSLFEETSQNQFDVWANVEAGVKLDWKVMDNLSVGTGLGFFTLKFKGSRNFLNSTFISTETPDTVVFTPNSNFNDPCDYYTNASFFSFDSKIEYNMIGLVIPLSLTYDIIPNRLQLSFGASLRTPIYSSRKRSSLNIEMETDNNGQTACTYVIHEDKNTTGNDFNDLTITGDFELTGWHKQFGLSLAISRWTTSIFSKNNGLNSFVFNDRKIAPGYYTLRLKYRLGKEQIQED